MAHPDGPVHEPAPHAEHNAGLTVVVAFVANALVAVAKTVAAVLTGSASMVAECAHSWADTGNEVFLLLAERRSRRPADAGHPFGYGRSAFVYTMVAAFGLFSVGAAVSIVNGISQFNAPEGEETNYTVGYVVLALSALLEGASFLQARGAARRTSERLRISTWSYILGTSNTTVRSVFFEDSSALVGIVIAASGMALHQITGDPRWDAVGSILVGVLLGIIAVFLMVRNGQFLVGEPASPGVRRQVLDQIRRQPGIARVSYLHLEYVGPASILVVASVDLTGDDPESRVAERLQTIEDAVSALPGVAACLLSLSAASDPGLPEIAGTDDVC